MVLQRSGTTVFDRETFERVHSEIEEARQGLPEHAVRAFAREVVARIVPKAPPLAALPVPVDHVDALCEALISDDGDAAAQMILKMRCEGGSLEVIYLDVLAAAARRLGEWWDQDRVSFTAVSIAAGRIYAILLTLRRAAPMPRKMIEKSVVFASVPGETHTLGVTMAADLLRNRGWSVELRVGYSHNDLVQALDHCPQPVIGLSAGTRGALLPLIRLIIALRICAPQSHILVSGQIAALDADAIVAAGADAAEPDFEKAVEALYRLAGVAAEQPN